MSVVGLAPTFAAAKMMTWLKERHRDRREDGTALGTLTRRRERAARERRRHARLLPWIPAR